MSEVHSNGTLPDPTLGGVVAPNLHPYRGLAWRSRFLRAPKMALVLAARDDFVEVGDLARVSLGLKTGADKFFFVRPVAPRTGGKAATRGGLLVSGYESWRGCIADADLLPALVGPQQMSRESGRRFLVPRTSGRFYVFPRRGKPRAELGDYIQVGELGGLHRQSLVKQNAGNGDWYRQTRSLVRAPWALPYNSAYDYGAWDNAAGAVLNGRFVGAQALAGVDSDLLGAALNSTFSLIGRLTEGMATGTEGAFDVGPPAVRRIRIPDIRSIDEGAAAPIREVLSAIRAGDAMPPAPASDGAVQPLRRRLDEALLIGLGLSRGKAAVLLDDLYASYGRWRRDVEEVETQMRRNRRQMSLSGRSRTIDPTILAGRRVWEEVSHDTPLVPASYLVSEDELEDIVLPRGAALPDHPRLIEPGVVSNGTDRLDLGSHDRLRYVAMLQRIGFVGALRVVCDSAKAGAIADLFEEVQARVLNEAERRAVSYVGRENSEEAAAVTLDCWHRACRNAGMKPLSENTGSPSSSPSILPPVGTG